MGFFERFGNTRSAGRYLNEANKYWKSAEQPFRAKDEFALARNLIEVIRNCQLSLAEDDHYGDAYVLLADALLLAGVSDPVKADKERSWYLVTRAAAVIGTWYVLPNRGYPITKNIRRGEKLFKTILGIVNAGELEAAKYPMKLINNYREQYANATISPKGLEEISNILLNRSHLKDKDEEHAPTTNHTPNSSQWFEETLLPAHRAFLAKVIHRLSNTSLPPQLDQRAARRDRMREMTEDLQDPSRILSTTEEILNRINDAYQQKDWRQILGWLVDIRLINDYRRSKPGHDEATMEKLEKSWADFLAPTINEARRAKDIDTMLLAIGCNYWLHIDEVAAKLLEEVRNEVGEGEMTLRMQKISENPIMIHEEATINKAREFINAN